MFNHYAAAHDKNSEHNRSGAPQAGPGNQKLLADGSLKPGKDQEGGHRSCHDDHEYGKLKVAGKATEGILEGNASKPKQRRWRSASAR